MSPPPQIQRPLVIADDPEPEPQTNRLFGPPRRRHLHRRNRAPCIQGDLDSLCGLYAIINGLRLVVPKPPRRFDEFLFNRLLDRINARRDINQVMQEGIDSEAAFKLLEAAAGFIEGEFGLGVRCWRLVNAQPRPTTIAAVLDGVADVIGGGGIVIAAFFGKLDHWTVIRRLTDHSLILHDSAGLTRVSRHHCRMGHEPQRMPHDHVLEPSALFAVAPGPSAQSG